MGMSRRLTKEDKLAFLGVAEDKEIGSLAQRILNPADGKEFHEGVAAGLILAIEIIDKHRKLDPAIATRVTLGALGACLQGCIQETLREEGE